VPTELDRATVVAALDDAWDHLLALGGELDDEAWATPSLCPGWTVKDLYSHVLGTESMLLGRPAPEADVSGRDHVRNDIGRFNEVWVAANADRPGPEVLAELRAVVEERRSVLSELADEAWDEVGFTPAGQDTHGRFMRIRVFDQWLHEQDARIPLGRPGHLSGPAVDLALDEIAASLGFVVGKRAGAPDGSAVRFELSGPTERTFDVLVEGRASVVEDLGRSPDVTIRMPLSTFVVLVAGRQGADHADPAIEVTGDRELGERVVANLAYTI
jgi:uncharacterized protein (TIGR03083 family)